MTTILIWAFGTHIFSEDEDSEMRVEFEHEGEHYKYLLVVNNLKVSRETLSHRTGGSFNYIFRRELTESSGYIIRQKGFGFAPKEAKRVRANASLISTAAQYNVPCAVKLADYFDRISSNIFVRDIINDPDLSVTAGFFYEHPELRGKMVKFMRQVDLGLTDVTIELLAKKRKQENRLLPFPGGCMVKAGANISCHSGKNPAAHERHFYCFRKSCLYWNTGA